MTLIAALAAARETRFSGQRTGEVALQRAARAVRFLGETRRASRVTEADLGRMVRAMRAQGLGPATCNRYLAALAVVLRAAGAAPALPWQTEPPGRTRWLTRVEVDALAAACLPKRHGLAVSTLVRFLAETGLRVGEALALQWADLELDGPRPHAQVRTSKNGDPRWVPLTSDAVQAARTRLDLPGGLVPPAAGPWYGLSQSVVNHVFRAAREAVTSTAGDPEVVVHTLRHTCGSRLVRANVTLPLVQAWLGHRDFRSTLRYVHPDQDGLVNASKLLQENS